MYKASREKYSCIRSHLKTKELVCKGNPTVVKRHAWDGSSLISNGKFEQGNLHLMFLTSYFT